MPAPLVTRVAPSPTGDPHVGTAYMALFNYCLAKTTGGRFILRVEDTDRTRYQEDSERQITESLTWLGLPYDEGPDVGGPNGPYRQSERTDIYRAHVQELVDGEKAYRCFCTAERLQEMRHAQRARKMPPGYDGLCRGLLPEEIEKRLADGVPYVVRLRVPKDRKVGFEDALRGKVEIDGKEIDDQVLLKSDGYPTYHLANVVDDHMMEVNEVVRAEEWITSTPKHVLLYEAFGWTMPTFRHMPLLRNKDKSKISKRKNPTSLLWYKDHGYLPEALVNFLALMGYSGPDDNEIFSLEQMLADFDTSRMSTSGPVFDMDKLGWLNGEYIRMDSEEALADRLIAHWAYRASIGAEPNPEGDGPLYDWIFANGGFASETVKAFILKTMPLMQTRIKTLEEYAPLGRCFFLDDVAGFSAEDITPKKRDLDGVKAVLKATHDALAELTIFDTASIETCLRGLVEPLEWKAREVFQVARVAVTGSKISPPLFESMELIGRDETLARLDAALALEA
ncbi:MAG: glutamate--tRNA ligase [Planctomycetota bacterium]|nr:glutamate--tRNA ligase [Planctomycetota bacterium]